jgi:membrane fusion protein (multidrug efflux system)
VNDEMGRLLNESAKPDKTPMASLQSERNLKTGSRRRVTTMVTATVALLILVAAVALLGGDGDSEMQADQAARRDVDTNSLSARDYSADSGLAKAAVKVTRGRAGSLLAEVSAPGEAVARMTTLSALTDGYVEVAAIRENDAVAAGDVLMTLRNEEAALRVREALADSARAEATFRELTAFDEGVSDAGMRQERAAAARVRAGLDGALVRLELARLERRRGTISAPFAGRIADLKVTRGQSVRAGETIMTIVELSPLLVNASVLEGDVSSVAVGAAVQLQFASRPNESTTGVVRSINPILDAKSRSARVSIEVANSDARYLPGMFARVTIQAARPVRGIILPRSALLERDGRPFVFEVDSANNRAVWHYVKVLATSAVMVAVESIDPRTPVRAGAWFASDGHEHIVHGGEVRPYWGNTR